MASDDGSLAPRAGRIVALLLLVAAGLTVVPAQRADAATFDVTRFDDPVPDGCSSGVDCSLREAVIAANANGGPDVIDLPNGTYSLTITGSLENSSATGDLDITDDLTINGSDPGTWVSAFGLAADPDRVFHSMNGAAVELVDLQVQDGQAPPAEPYGGGILQENGSLTLTRVGVHDNSNPGSGSPNDADGGGIATLGGDLTLDTSAIQSNSTNDDGGGVAMLGGGLLTLTDSSIDQNTVTGPGTGGGVSTKGANGGGLYVGPSATGDFTNASFGNNTVLDTDEYSGGGGLFIAGSVVADEMYVSQNAAGSFGGGGHIAEDGSLTASNLRVNTNDAGGAGGGLAVQGTLDVTSGSVAFNTASGAAGLIVGSNDGPTGDVTFGGVRVEENVADSVAGLYVFPGAGFSMNGGWVRANTATSGGVGGIANLGTMSLSNVAVSENTAADGAGGILNAATLDITSASVSNNDAGDGPGGGIFTSGSTTLDMVLVEDNAATSLGGGLLVTGGSVDGTDVAVRGHEGPLLLGGGIYQVDTGSGPADITLHRAVISDNTVSSGGGGVVLDNGTHSFTNTTVSGNQVTDGSGEGGGIMVGGSGTLDLEFSTVVDNSASEGGGVENMDTSTVTYTASLISDNAGGDCDTYDSGVRVSNDFNVAGDNTCGFGQSADVNNAGPMLGSTLGPLADNGGWFGVMLTHALLPGNPALDLATNPRPCPATDERGNSRPNGPACDSGAFEAAYTPPTPTDHNLTIDKTLVGEARSGGDARWNITIGNSGTDPAPGRLTFADTLPDAVRFVSVDAPEWDCSTEGRTLTCFYDGDLAPGVVTKLDIVATVVGPPGSSVANTASVSTFGSVDPTFATAPGTVAGPGESPGDPTPGEPGNEPTDAGLTDSVGPGGSLPFTGFDLTSIALGALVAVVVGTTLAWRPRRGASA